MGGEWGTRTLRLHLEVGRLMGSENKRTDVIVIGSGAAGAAVTWRLAELGAKVTCLEQGDWVKPGDYPSTQPNYEVQLKRGPFHFNPNIRKRPEDYPVVTGEKICRLTRKNSCPEKNSCLKKKLPFQKISRRL